MKKQIQIYLIILLAIQLLSCDLLKKAPEKSNSLGNTVIRVSTAFNDPISSVTIEKNGHKVGVTDQNGVCTFYVDPTKYGTLADFKMIRHDIQLNFSKNVRVEKTIDIVTDINIGDYDVLSSKVNARKESLVDFDQDLNKIQALLDELEKRIDDYIIANGESAIKNYKSIIDSSRNTVFQLGKRIKSLKERYSETLSGLSMKEIRDIHLYETEFESLDNEMRWLESKTNKTARELDDNIKANPKYSIAYYYKSGAKLPKKSSLKVNRELEFFLKKLEDYLYQKFPNGDNKDLSISVIAVGYTDGEPIDPQSNLATKLKSACNGTIYNKKSYPDLNFCLGYQRAKEIIDLIKPLNKIKGVKFSFSSEGPKLAKGKVTEDQSLRKCVLSYAIYSN